ncbi:GGDEF domain-containing protein [Marinobacter koreensis]
MGIPLAVFCVALLAVALFVAVYDLQERRERILKQQQENERVARKAFVDPVTGLPNRSGLEQRLLDALASEDARRHPFALVHLDVANFRALANRLGPKSLDDVIREVAGAIRDLLPETVYLARYSNSGFFLLVPDYQESGHQFLFRQLRELDQRIGTSAVPLLWRAGQSVFPVTGNSSRKLIRAAMVPRDLSEIGRFENVKADPEMVLPGNKAVS